MAAKINTPTEKADRQDTFKVHPEDAKVVKNSRMIPNPDYAAKVRSLAIDIAINGQLQPALTRRDANRNLLLVAGHTRRDAIALLREGFDAIDPRTGESFRFHDPEAKLWVKVEDMTDAEAFIASLSENIKREDMTDVQEALAQAELRDTLGWTDGQIAAQFGYSNQNRVSHLKKLLKMGKRTIDAVHNGKVSLFAVLATEGMSETDRDELLDATAGPDGKVNASSMKELIRSLTTETGKPAKKKRGGEDDEPSGNLKRNASDFKKFVADIKGEDSDVELDEGAIDLLDTLVKFFAGSVGPRAVTNKLEALRSK